jgi:hypothetical protein
MKVCPNCDRELSPQDIVCPSCKKSVKTPFTLRNFLWENYRYFTMIGLMGTMLSLIPNMGIRILGESWITNSANFLPLFLSMSLFFGIIYMNICFFMLFDLIFQFRKLETVIRSIMAGSTPLLTQYEGDVQRLILLMCLVPMWIGITLFFVLIIPLIPNKYSEMFASIPWLSVILLIMVTFAGWSIGKKLERKIPGLGQFPNLFTAMITVLAVAITLIALPLIPSVIAGPNAFSGDMAIRTDQQYFSPHISSAKGLRLTIMNVSGDDLDTSMHSWSADSGYFITVVPSTSNVIILGNPVTNDGSQDMYWTYSDPPLEKKPVKIDISLSSVSTHEKIGNASLYLTWYTDDIVYVNRSFVPR